MKNISIQFLSDPLTALYSLIGMILNCWNDNEKKACATLYNWSSSLSVSGWHLSHKKGKSTNKK